MHADLVLLGGEIVPVPGKPERATALAVLCDRIVAVGADEEIRLWVGPHTEVVKLHEEVVLPGFNDAHLHFVQIGLNRLQWVSLAQCRSIADIIDILRQRAQDLPEGQWLLGEGFDQDLLAEKRYPTPAELDEASRKHPIFLSRVCGHAGIVNTVARELIDQEELATVPATDYDWEAGLFTERALEVAEDAIPEPSMAELVQAVEVASEMALAVGLTSVQCMVSSSEEVLAYREARRRGTLRTRVTLHYPLDLQRQLTAVGLATGFGDEMLKIGAIKLFADGSLGSRTAALRAPYTDAPSTQGTLLYTEQNLYRKAKAIHDAGFQLAIHAIGDAAIAQVLAVYEKLLGKAPADNRTYRHRIEHAALLPTDLLTHMAQSHIVGVVQPQFVVSDFWAIDRVGPQRVSSMYPFKTMLAAGIITAFSSDSPVERLDPFETLARAMTREPHTRQESLTLEQGLAAYTVGSAYADFEDTRKGRLLPGMLADMVILPKCFLGWDAAHVGKTRPVGVVMAGKIHKGVPSII